MESLFVKLICGPLSLVRGLSNCGKLQIAVDAKLHQIYTACITALVYYHNIRPEIKKKFIPVIAVIDLQR